MLAESDDRVDGRSTSAKVAKFSEAVAPDLASKFAAQAREKFGNEAHAKLTALVAKLRGDATPEGAKKLAAAKATLAALGPGVAATFSEPAKTRPSQPSVDEYAAQFRARFGNGDRAQDQLTALIERFGEDATPEARTMGIGNRFRAILPASYDSKRLPTTRLASSRMPAAASAGASAEEMLLRTMENVSPYF